MKRKVLLGPALAALASALLAFTFYGLSDAVAARAARQSDAQTTQGSLYAIDPTGKAASACPLKHTDAVWPEASTA